jgi:hypothetical protein
VCAAVFDSQQQQLRLQQQGPSRRLTSRIPEDWTNRPEESLQMSAAVFDNQPGQGNYALQQQQQQQQQQDFTRQQENYALQQHQQQDFTGQQENYALHRQQENYSQQQQQQQQQDHSRLVASRFPEYWTNRQEGALQVGAVGFNKQIILDHGYLDEIEVVNSI